MDPTPRGGIPVIGRLTVPELLGFIGLILAAAGSLWEVVWLLGEHPEPAPLAMFVIPAALAFGSILVSSCIGFALLLRRVRARLEGRSAHPALPPHIDVNVLKRLTDALTASMVVQAASMVIPLLARTMTPEFAVVVLLAIVASGLVFLVCLGMLAARLGRNWILWVVLTMLTPFGPFIAYFLMRKIVKDAIGTSPG